MNIGLIRRINFYDSDYHRCGPEMMKWEFRVPLSEETRQQFSSDIFFLLNRI